MPKASTSKVQVRGIGGVARKLDAVGLGIARISEGAIGKVLQRMKDDAQVLVPVRTGALKASIDYQIERDAPHTVRGELTATMEYASYVEYGTSKMAAQPYLRPAYEAHKDELMNELVEGIKEVKEARSEGGDK